MRFLISLMVIVLTGVGFYLDWKVAGIMFIAATLHNFYKDFDVPEKSGE